MKKKLSIEEEMFWSEAYLIWLCMEAGGDLADLKKNLKKHHDAMNMYPKPPSRRI